MRADNRTGRLCYHLLMGVADSRTRWILPGLVAVVAIALVVIFSGPPEVTLPPAPEGRDRDGAVEVRAFPELPGGELVFAGRIEGRVLRGGRGIGAAVTLRVFAEFPGQPLRSGRADGSGFFAFSGVPPGLHEVSAIGADGVDGVAVRRRVTVVAGVAPMPIELSLPDGEFTLRGRAVHADGRAFSGEVEVRPAGGSEACFVSTRAAGRFVVAGLSAGRALTRFRSGEAFFAEGRSVVLPADGEVVFVVDEGAREVRGRVVSAATGEPVVGAEVSISGHLADARGFHVTSRSAADGSFAVAAPLPDGRVPCLVVRAEGFRPWRMDRFQAADTIRIALEPSARVTVHVVSAADGAPVPFVPVRAWYESIPDLKDHESLLTDRHGRVVFSSIPGDSVEFHIRDHGFVLDPGEVPEERRFLLLSPGEEREIELPVRRAAALLGRVTTAAGDPVDDCAVGYLAAGLATGRERCDPGGRFLLSDLPPGEFQLQASRHFLTSEAVRGILAPGEVREVELELEAGAWLSVEVRGGDTGLPIEEARVEVRGGEDAATDAAGRVLLGPIQPGHGLVVVRLPGYLTWRERVEYGAGGTTSFTAVLDRGMSLAGKVVRRDGNPAGGALVEWFGGGDWDHRQSVCAATDGTFHLRGLPPGRIQIKATLTDASGGRHRGIGTFDAGSTDAFLVLDPEACANGRSVRVTVTGPDGNPVPKGDFDVLARDAAGRRIWETSREIVAGAGEFEVTGAIADLLLYVHGARRPGGGAMPLGAARFGPFPADVATIEVALPPERVITGKVVGPDGSGVPRLDVSGGMASFPGADVVDRFPWNVITRADGTFRIGGLGEGEVTLQVFGPEGLEQPDLTVVSAGERGVVIRLDSLVSVTVTVRDQRGEPVDNAEVEVWNQAHLDRGGSRWESSTFGKSNPTGRVPLEDLPGATLHVLVARPPEDSGLGPARVDDWFPRDTEVILPAGLTLSGRVVGSDGAPLEEYEGDLWLWTRTGGWQSVEIAEGGELLERGLPDGRVALVWFPPGSPFDEPDVPPDRLDLPVSWYRAGAKEIVFRVPSR